MTLTKERTGATNRRMPNVRQVLRVEPGDLILFGGELKTVPSAEMMGDIMDYESGDMPYDEFASADEFSDWWSKQ